jgi:hypothetical protein
LARAWSTLEKSELERQEHVFTVRKQRYVYLRKSGSVKDADGLVTSLKALRGVAS